MYCELCKKPIDPKDKYHIEGYVNQPSGIPRSIYVHTNGSCPDADIEMFTKTCPTCKKVFETYDEARVYCSATCANHERFEQTVNVIREKYTYTPNEKRSEIEALRDNMRQAMTDMRASNGKLHHATKERRPEAMKQVPPETRREPTDTSKVGKFVVRNEQGVVWMFSKMAKNFGWEALDIRTGYPDATFLNAAGQRFEVEFEYASSNFVTHGHDPSGCDFVVCWIEDKPLDGVEVLALGSL